MRKCPNCTEPVKGHPDTGCIIAAFISCIRDRGTTPEKKLLTIHADIDVDAVWNTVGPLLDRIADGEFS